MPLSLTIPLVAPQKSAVHSYHPVPAPDEETLLASPDSKDTRNPPLKHNFFPDPSFWLTAFAALSIALTIWNLLVIQLGPREPISYPEASIRSPYNGLEKLVRNESSPSWPLSSTHYPDFIGATEGLNVHHALNNGSLVWLDSERTIIIQHRVRDYGLEYCIVKLEFSHSAGNRHGHAARAYEYIGERSYLTLWRLEDAGNNAVLAPSSLPTPSPSRKELLGDILLDGTHSMRSPSFACKMGSIQTLEIAVACASDPCIMEFQLTRSPRQGLLVVQSEQESTPT